MKIVFIRHGQTDYNEKKAFYGSTDVSINETGKKQARIIHNKVKKYRLNNIYTSEMSRTIETAKIIFPIAKVQKKKFLNELGFGMWEGMTADEIQENFPLEWISWLNNPFEYTPPGASSFKSHKEKVILGFKKIIADNENIAFVIHLGTIRILLNYIFPEVDFWDIYLEQENIIVIEYSEGIFKKEKWDL